MVISVFGKSGSGKTTVATHLAKYLSNLGYFVGIISAEIRYGDVQRRLGIKIEDGKSLLNAIIDYKNSQNYFSRITDNLYLLSVHDGSTIKEYEDIVKILGTRENQTAEQVNRIHSFVESVSGIFDFLIVDCTDRINDTITYSFISKSDKVFNIIESSVSGVTFCNAHKYLGEFDFYKNKINILNKHYEKAINRSTIENLIEENIEAVIPYRETTVLKNIKAQPDEKLLSDIKKLNEILNPKEKKTRLFDFMRKKR